MDYSPSFDSGSQNDLFMMDYDSQYAFPSSPAKPNIDMTKFKTKLCRNYIMGIPCPFEDRCAFAHGPEEQQARQPTSPNSQAPPAYDSLVFESEGDETRPSTPPSYPSRFRYDPYSVTGIVFKH